MPLAAAIVIDDGHVHPLVLRINAGIFGISENDIAVESFRYVGNFKLAITVLCFTPYIALKLMT